MNDLAFHPRGTFNIISLCAGGGGLDLGVELAIPSARPVCYVEREAFAVAHLVAAIRAQLMAPGPIWSDVGTFDGRPWRGLVDGVIGGIPCQPHSLAGRKRGSLDERDLWSDARRIIVQARPWFVLIENVGGMLSAGDDEVAGAERVCRDLRKLGFTVEGGLFTAAEVGASHQRERVFILGLADAYFSGLGGEGNAGEPSEFLSEAIRAVADGNDKPGRGQRELGGREGPRERKQSGRRGAAMADAAGPGREGSSGGSPNGECAAVERSGEGLVDPVGGGRNRRADEPIGRQVERTAAERPGERSQRDMVDPSSLGRSNVADGSGPAGQHVETLDRAASRDGDGGDPGRNLSGQREDAAQAWVRPLFAPGPGDRENWKTALERAPELEPAFRRVADGMAARLDTARIDRIRMLGNGVVPLQAARAIRTLAYRLALRGYDRIWRLCA
jgi:DNA (cytosine-5)-methyltransferase 1